MLMYLFTKLYYSRSDQLLWWGLVLHCPVYFATGPARRSCWTCETWHYSHGKIHCILQAIDFFCSEYLLIIFKLHLDKNHRTVLSNVYNILLFYFPGNPFQILFLKIWYRRQCSLCVCVHACACTWLYAFKIYFKPLWFFPFVAIGQ